MTYRNHQNLSSQIPVVKKLFEFKNIRGVKLTAIEESHFMFQRPSVSYNKLTKIDPGKTWICDTMGEESITENFGQGSLT